MCGRVGDAGMIWVWDGVGERRDARYMIREHVRRSRRAGSRCILPHTPLRCGRRGIIVIVDALMRGRRHRRRGTPTHVPVLVDITSEPTRFRNSSLTRSTSPPSHSNDNPPPPTPN